MRHLHILTNEHKRNEENRKHPAVCVRARARSHFMNSKTNLFVLRCLVITIQSMSVHTQRERENNHPNGHLVWCSLFMFNKQTIANIIGNIIRRKKLVLHWRVVVANHRHHHYHCRCTVCIREKRKKKLNCINSCNRMKILVAMITACNMELS